MWSVVLTLDWDNYRDARPQISAVTLWTTLLMLHLISFNPHAIVHVSSDFLQFTLHWSCFIFISFKPHSTSFISSTTVHLIHITLFGCTHITWSFNLIVNFTFQPIPSMEINNLRVSLNKFLILDRYSLLEAELRWFYNHSLFYIKQGIQHEIHDHLIFYKLAYLKRLLQR